MRQIRNMQQGDSFTMNFIIKNNGTPQDIQTGEDLAVGFYDEYGSRNVLKLSEGQIQESGSRTERDNIGKYTAFVSSDITKHFVGNVDVEIVVYDINDTEDRNVSHGDKVLKLYFEERKINLDIDE